MSEPRLTTEFWVTAHIRRLGQENISALLVRRGSDVAGQVLVKLNTLVPRDEEGCTVFVQSYDHAGNRGWRAGTGRSPVSEEQADDYIRRTLKFDPDIWVLEVEDRQGRHFLDPVIEDPSSL